MAGFSLGCHDLTVQGSQGNPRPHHFEDDFIECCDSFSHFILKIFSASVKTKKVPGPPRYIFTWTRIDALIFITLFFTPHCISGMTIISFLERSRSNSTVCGMILGLCGSIFLARLFKEFGQFRNASTTSWHRKGPNSVASKLYSNAFELSYHLISRNIIQSNFEKSN